MDCGIVGLDFSVETVDFPALGVADCRFAYRPNVPPDDLLCEYGFRHRIIALDDFANGSVAHTARYKKGARTALWGGGLPATIKERLRSLHRAQSFHQLTQDVQRHSCQFVEAHVRHLRESFTLTRSMRSTVPYSRRCSVPVLGSVHVSNLYVRSVKQRKKESRTDYFVVLSSQSGRALYRVRECACEYEHKLLVATQGWSTPKKIKKVLLDYVRPRVHDTREKSTRCNRTRDLFEDSFGALP